MTCKEATLNMASQIKTLLQEMDAADYARPLEIFKGSTLGQHFRHIIDFYRCLLRDVNQGIVDYGDRERETDVETDPGYAIHALNEITGKIELLQEQQSLQVRADFSTHESEGRPLVFSSIGRELMFAYDHAVHHLAIIRIGLRVALPDLLFDENLGVAPSTVKYRTHINAEG